MDDDLAYALALQAQEEEYAGSRRRAAYDDDDESDESDESDDDARFGRAAAKSKKRAVKTTTTTTTTDGEGEGEGDDDDGANEGAANRATAPRARGTRDGRVIMRRMLELGLVAAGENVLSTTLRKEETLADLKEDGTIVWRRARKIVDPAPVKDEEGGEETAVDAADVETLVFNTVSEFRLAVVREKNPERKVDNGWDWVKYAGVKLGDIKRRLPPEPKPEPKPRAKREPKPTPTPKKRKKITDDERGYHAAVKRIVVPAREKRESRNASKNINIGESFDGQGDLQMVTCEAYNKRRTQPFKVTVTSGAELVMDFHAHLCSDEIIGFLGGVYDDDAKTLRITRALPARQLVQEHAGVEVELDPESVPAIVETLTAKGEGIVGWYHSHPVFATQPSIRDIQNQFEYQKMFARSDGESQTIAPFVGAIVGPYDVRNDSQKSDVRMFHCVDFGGEPEPYELKVEHAGCEDVSPDVLRELKGLADRFRTTPHAGVGDSEPLAAIDLNATPVSLTEHWRDGTTRLEKFEHSLCARLPKSWQDETKTAYVGGIVKYLKTAWGVAAA
jgi:proteasome lid subunit RPN8/RPN11